MDIRVLDGQACLKRVAAQCFPFVARRFLLPRVHLPAVRIYPAKSSFTARTE